VTAGVWAVDLQLPQPDAVGASTSGCERRDFNRMPAGSIALVQRGTCTFVEKQENAEQAGAAAVIVFNDGFAGRTLGVWTDASGQDIPVLAPPPSGRRSRTASNPARRAGRRTSAWTGARGRTPRAT